MGYLGFKYAASIHHFLPSADMSSFTKDFSGALENFFVYFVKLMGIEGGYSLFSLHGIVNVIKLAGGILLLIVFPALQIRKFRSETPAMRFFTAFACIHVLEILLLEGKKERDAFLNCESSMLFGEPHEVLTCDGYYIYVYDYNIANNDFGGIAGGFTGSEITGIFTLKNELGAKSVFKYSEGSGYELISSPTSYAALSDDDIVMICAEDLPGELSSVCEAAGTMGGYTLYLTENGKIGYSAASE